MKNESRQVRRARERDRQPSSRMSPLGLIATVILFVLALAVVIVVKYTQSLSAPTVLSTFSPTPIAETALFQHPNFTPVTTWSHDGLVQVTAQFTSEYGHWIEANYRTLKGGEALDIFRELHNRYVPRFKEQGVTLPILERRRPVSYRTVITPLVDALYERNVSAWFFVPVALPESTARGVNVRIGRVIARRTGSLVTIDGQRLEYTEEIIDRQVSIFAGDSWSITDPLRRRITHFLYEWDAEATQLVQQVMSGAQAKAGSTDQLCWLQWRSLADAKMNPAELQRLIEIDLIEASTAHERQHLRDLELMTLQNDAVAEDRGIPQLQFFVELRGMLRSVADGPIPFYVLAQNMELAKRRTAASEAYRQATNQVAHLVNFPNLLGVSIDNPDAGISELRKRAHRYLAYLDRHYRSIEHLTSDPDPVRTTRRIVSNYWRSVR